jgi:hypothetical protein
VDKESNPTKNARIAELEAKVRGLQHQIDLLIQAQQPMSTPGWMWQSPYTWTWPGNVTSVTYG